MSGSTRDDQHAPALTARREADDAYLPTGRFRLQHLRDGLLLHSSDGLENGRATPESSINRCMICSIVLDGAVEAFYDGRPVAFGPGNTGTRRAANAPDAVLISVAEPVRFSRHARPGTRTRKVNVTIDEAWLEQAGLLSDARDAAISRFARDHLAVQRWRPNRRTVELVEEILRPSPVMPELEPLYLESRAIELISEATGTLAGDATAAPEPGLRRRARDIEAYLEENLTRPLELRTIAEALAMSPSSLQRTCRAAFGTSVFDLLRRKRLDAARRSLAADGISVAQAAYLAGYNNPANFATAFKRAYGVPPSEIRCRR